MAQIKFMPVYIFTHARTIKIAGSRMGENCGTNNIQGIPKIQCQSYITVKMMLLMTLDKVFDYF